MGYELQVKTYELRVVVYGLASLHDPARVTQQAIYNADKR